MTNVAGWCFTRLRYDAARCDASRLDADAVEDAMIAALTGFYRAGTDTQRKALIETLVAHIKVTGPDRIVPVFRIPCPAGTDHAAGLKPSGERNPQASHAVRAMTKSGGPNASRCEPRSCRRW